MDKTGPMYTGRTSQVVAILDLLVPGRSGYDFKHSISNLILLWHLLEISHHFKAVLSSLDI